MQTPAPSLLEAATALLAAFDKHQTWVKAGVMRAALPYSEKDLRAESEKAMDDLRAAVAAHTTGNQVDG